jgi:N-acetylneuraminic acid mutarotase
MLYVIGGRAGSPLNNLERYDPISNTWVTLASMPTARAAAAAAVLDNSIIVIGGRTGTGGPCSGGALSAVELYDIDTNTWSTLAPLPAPRSDLSAVAHGGNVYVFGGCDTFQSPVNDAFVYDPQTDSWSSIASMPTARASAVAGKKGELVYVIGGWNGGNLANNEIYDISHDTWSVGLAMPTPRSETGSFSHGGRIYVLGGGPFGASVSANEMFKP